MEKNNTMNQNPHCPVIDIDGFIEKGKEFDIDITLPEDNREVIFGTLKDCFKEPIKDAVIKLIEIEHGKDGCKKREPVSHTFTDEHGEFVFGPLCPGKEYSLEIWVNEVRTIKVCAKCHHEGNCLKIQKSDNFDCNCTSKKED